MQRIFRRKDYVLLFKKFRSVENRTGSKLNIQILVMLAKDQTTKINTCVGEASRRSKGPGKIHVTKTLSKTKGGNLTVKVEEGPWGENLCLENVNLLRQIGLVSTKKK